MTTIRRREADKMIITNVREESAVVEWDDITGDAEYDDNAGCAPWEECDGLDHEFTRETCFTHDGERDSRGWVRRASCEGGPGRITIDDADVIKWGCTGHTGCSKQVRAETIAAAKRDAIDQLVKWYTDGWYASVASAEYGDYSDSVGGIWDEPGGDFTAECVLECRHNVADQLEKDGYTVVGRPVVKTYQENRIDAKRRQIRYNLTGVWE